MSWREKTNPGTGDDSDWFDVETDQSSVADVEFESLSANGRRTYRLELPAETRRQQSSSSVRQTGRAANVSAQQHLVCLNRLTVLITV